MRTFQIKNIHTAIISIYQASGIKKTKNKTAIATSNEKEQISHTNENQNSKFPYSNFFFDSTLSNYLKFSFNYKSRKKFI